MCIEVSRQHGDGRLVDAAAAGNFAAAAVLSVLGAADWQVSADTEAAMTEMVDRLGGAADEVTVLVHRDHVELLASAGGRLEQQPVSARSGFATDVTCSLQV